jgi:uncharacterized protein (DUF2336 family)
MQTLLSDVDVALTNVSSARRSAMLRQVTDLLLAGGMRYSPEQLSVFDAVMRRLTQDVDQDALIELSGRLAAMEPAPADVAGRLSHHDNIEVARPVLEKCGALSDQVLVSVAKAKSQYHLLAIAGRKQVNVVVTDVLVDRGNLQVKLKVVGNGGALFSEYGFARLVTDARTDQKLATLVRRRPDIPPELAPFLKTIPT